MNHVDEAGVDDTEDYTWFGGSDKTISCLEAGASYQSHQRPGWCKRRDFSSMTFEGYCNTACGGSWIEQFWCLY